MTVRRTDFWTGLVISALGGGALVESLRMPRFAERNIDPNTIPGLTPGLISAVLLLLGLMLTARALAGRGTGAGVTITDWSFASARRMAIVVSLTLVYGLLLFGNIPFFVATALYILAFTVAVEAVNPDRIIPMRVVVPGALALAVIAGFGIEFVFREVFLVRLPG